MQPCGKSENKNGYSEECNRNISTYLTVDKINKNRLV